MTRLRLPRAITPAHRMHPTTTRRLLATVTLPLVLAACDRVERQKALDGGSYAALAQDAIPRVEQATGLKFKHPPAIAARSSKEVRGFVQAQLEEPAAKAALEGREQVWKRLGAIPEKTNLRDLYVDLLEEQVVGYYDPKRDTLYVVEGRDDAQVRMVVAHELIHALQDQYVNLDSILSQRGDDDRAGAAQAVLEGQATYDYLVSMTGGLINAATNWNQARDQIRAGRNATPRMAAAPTIVQEALLFPYLSGAEFVKRERDADANANPLARFPVSSEQVMHAEKFAPVAEPPIPVRITGVSGVTFDNTIGEFETRVALYEQLRNVQQATQVARGWGGDRVVIAGDLMVWASAWDTEVDASEFYDAIGNALGVRYQAAATGAAGASQKVIAGQGRRVTITIGEAGGKPTVLVVDAPEGRGTPVTLANVQVGNGGTP